MRVCLVFVRSPCECVSGWLEGFEGDGGSSVSGRGEGRDYQ